VSNSEFVCFRAPDDQRVHAKWGPKENRIALTPCGFEHDVFFEAPFQCIVRKRQMADIIWAALKPCLISERVVDLFHSAGLTGFEIRPADVRLMFPHEPSESVYWQLIVTGWGGIVSPESGIRQVIDPTRPDGIFWGTATNPGAIIDAKQWDGSDFFIVWPLPNYWWISQRVVDVLMTNRLRRYEIAAPSEMDILCQAYSDGIKFSPGRLRQFFSLDRARHIGEPLGIF
jgi:hypothetical protein